MLPIALLIVLMLNNVIEGVNNYTTDERTSNVYKAAAKMTNAIFELQQERAMSNTALLSNTAFLKERLKVQREKTTLALTILIAMDKNPLMRGLFPEVVYRIYFDNELIELVNRIRGDVDQGKGDEYFEQYTEIIVGILRLFSAKSMMTDEPEINSHIIALSKVIWLQEYAGRERSISYALLSNSGNTDELLQNHFYNSSRQRALSKDIVALSGIEDVREAFEELQRSHANTVVKNARDTISIYNKEYISGKKRSFNYNFGGIDAGSDWLDISGERLVLINQLAKNIIDKIIYMTESDKGESLYKIMIHTTVAILAILLTFMLGFIITGRMILGIETVTQAINDIKSGEQMDPDVKLTGYDEISVLSHEFYDLAYEKALAEKDVALAAKVFSHTSDAVLILDDSFTVINSNKAFNNLTGIEDKAVAGLKINDIFKREQDHDFFESLWDSLKKHDSWQGEFMLVWPNGKKLTTWSNVTVVRNDKGLIENYIFVYTDISVLLETQKQIEYLAQHDLLTGLANRTQFEAYLEKTIARARRHDKHIAMLFMDLNKFKNINDNLGHAIGDIVLKEISERISLCLREEDFIARQGGDEFIGIIEGVSKQKDIIKILEKIIKSVETPIHLENRELHLGISIGVSMYPDDAANLGELSSHSDMAMYKAKEEAKSNYKFFTDRMNEIVKEKFKVENNLRRALKANELEVYYQPIINMLNNNISGAESLIRWKHPEFGYMPPTEFIPVAEDSGLIIELGNFVIEQTFSLLDRNHKLFGNEFVASINVSPEQIRHGHLVEKLLKEMQHYNLKPSDIQIEITENMLVESASSEIDALQKIHDAGLRIAIDDFGTGYSSLKYLKDFPIDVVKIDGSFVKGVASNREDAMLVRTIIEMAYGLGKELIAEGVETEKQKEFLLKSKCTVAQGFLYSRALSAHDFLRFIAKSNDVAILDVS